MKPRWFYDYIGMVAKHDHKLGLKAWDAELLDHVAIDVTIKQEHTDIYDPIDGMGGSIATLPGFSQLYVDVKDVPVGDIPPRFNPIRMWARADSLNYYIIDMNPDNGQYRPLCLFENMYIDYGAAQHSWRGGRLDEEWTHYERWVPDEKWYFIYPMNMTVSTKNKRKQMDLW